MTRSRLAGTFGHDTQHQANQPDLPNSTRPARNCRDYAAFLAAGWTATTTPCRSSANATCLNHNVNRIRGISSSKLHSSAAERRKRKALGASPRESSISESKAPEGRQHSQLHRSLSPLQGFVFHVGVFRGFAPTAIRCRPSGTNETVQLQNCRVALP